jgi:hypothetical protein
MHGHPSLTHLEHGEGDCCASPLPSAGLGIAAFTYTLRGDFPLDCSPSHLALALRHVRQATEVRKRGPGGSGRVILRNEVVVVR